MCLTGGISFRGSMTQLRAALIVGVVSLLWATYSLSLGQLLGVTFLLYVVSGGHYTLWIAYKTLPRDLK